MIIGYGYLAPPPYDPGPAAQAYSQFATTLAGFALAGLVVYLGRHYLDPKVPVEHLPAGASPANPLTPDSASQSGIGAQPSESSRATDAGEDERTAESPTSGRARPVLGLVDDIAAALFYSMAALAICGFLYASLGGEPVDSSRGATEMVLYGVVFGLSVLSLFYAIALMLAEHEDVRPAANHVYWVVAVAGPIIVMRFFVAAVYNAWKFRCPDGCGSSLPLPVGVGVGLLVILLVVSVLARRGHIRWRWHESTEDGRVWPVKWMFWLTATVALVSLIIALQRPGFTFPPAMSYILLVLGSLALGCFSIACASVFNARDLNVEQTPGVR